MAGWAPSVDAQELLLSAMAWLAPFSVLLLGAQIVLESLHVVPLCYPPHDMELSRMFSI